LLGRNIAYAPARFTAEPGNPSKPYFAAAFGFSLISEIIGFSLSSGESPVNPMNALIASLRQMRQSFVPSTAAAASPVNGAVQPTSFDAWPTSRYLRPVENLVMLSVAGYFGWAFLAVAFS